MKILNKIYYLVVLIIILGSCKGKEEEKAEVLRPVRFQVVSKMGAITERNFNGVAAASEETDLSFRSNGIITKLNFQAGSRVRQGQLIARLDNVQANLAYEQAVSALSAAESNMNTAKSSLERTKTLYEKGNVSLSEYEAAKNSYQSALDNFESSKKNKDIQQTQINYGFIYAPADGVIAQSNNEINENVIAGQVIAVLNSGDGINVEVGLPGSVINKIELNLKAEVSFTDLESGGFEGSVIEIAPILDANTSIFPVKIKVLKPSSELRPGMIAVVRFVFENKDSVGDDSIIIPVKAIGEDGEGRFVFLVESTSDSVATVKKHYITIGELTNAGFKVQSGLTDGQKIATAGLQTLIDGQKVSLQ